jgi:hypothetical protein
MSEDTVFADTEYDFLIAETAGEVYGGQDIDGSDWQPPPYGLSSPACEVQMTETMFLDMVIAEKEL